MGLQAILYAGNFLMVEIDPPRPAGTPLRRGRWPNPLLGGAGVGLQAILDAGNFLMVEIDPPRPAGTPPRRGQWPNPLLGGAGVGYSQGLGF